jgi:VanZ family protein
MIAHRKIPKLHMSTVICGILLLLLYCLIFGFSNQDGETSGGISRFISEKCVELINTITGGHWTEELMDSMAAYWEHPLRKFAHFSEYTVMGILVFHILRQFLHKGKRHVLITLLWVFLSAAADEFHQLFIPGRYASIADVLLDTCGGAFGILLSCIWIRFIMHRISLRSKDAAPLG